MSTAKRWACAAVSAVALSVSFVPTAAAVDETDTTKLREAVTVNGILQHTRSLQAIANRNGGNRQSGTPGYDESVAYVSQRLKAAGYKVSEQEFTFPFYRENASSLTQDAPAAKTYETAPYEYSGDGTVTGRVVPVSNNVIPATPEPSSAAGCAVGDYTPAAAGTPEIALVQRGTCTFREKVTAATSAGYDGVIIFNEGNPERTELFVGTLDPPLAPVPVLGLSYADGVELAQAAGAGDVTVTLSTDIEYDPARKTKNVIADSKAGDKDRVLVVGSHLDSVAAGPGINDNGSGSAGILEIAEELAKLKKPKLQQKVRFAFWGAEESGLLGSEHYVQTLGDTGIQSIFANLNFDMIGSPNYVRFVYDGDGSTDGVAGPPGSGQIESVFEQYFDGQGLATAPTAFDGRSDYGPFIAVGIPAGGLFSGAEGVKTEEEAAVFGGTAGAAYDPCYHQACDDITNLSTKALFELGDGAAHAVLTLARTKTGFYEDGSRRAATTVQRSHDHHGVQAIR